METKLLVCDLDDTLLVNSLPPSKRIAKAIKEVKSAGIHVTIATGRMHISALPYAKILDVTMPVISYNGSLIKDYKTGEVVSEMTVSREDAAMVLEFAKEHDVYIQYYSDNGYYFYEHCEYSDSYHRSQGIRGTATGEDLIKGLNFAPQKLLINTESYNADVVYEEAIKVFEGRLNVTRSTPEYVEFNNPLASKGQACKKLAEMYNIKMDNVMTIGNGDNDYDMVKDAGFGVAVGNATDKLKSVADYIAPDCRKDGAAIAIEKYILEKL